MTVLLQIDFKIPGEMLGDRLAEMATPLAQSITQEPGFISKIWTENVDAGEAGGIYLFSDKTSAEQYAAMHIKRVAQMGATDIRSRIFDINVPLTHITRGNLKPAS